MVWNLRYVQVAPVDGTYYLSTGNILMMCLIVVVCRYTVDTHFQYSPSSLYKGSWQHRIFPNSEELNFNQKSEKNGLVKPKTSFLLSQTKSTIILEGFRKVNFSNTSCKKNALFIDSLCVSFTLMLDSILL